ncbi:RNA 2',3'-cyclic phosphodiesterase [Natronomonas sp. EA1]|uniref:RNA 2',3'-cyclic phosphodiesterase n=1 Tax=Natronomonas sp. EA1 TaxID=3421655 RepID=UPI003EB9CA33
MRTFVSIDLDGLADAVAEAQEPFDRAGLRPVDPAGAHVTLKFLGEVAPDRVPALTNALAEAVAAADVAPFTATFEGYGVFPSLDYISVIWLGVGEGAAEMTRLATAIEDRFEALGFDRERHEFTPHVTVARMDDAREKAHVQDVVENRQPAVGPLEVSEVRLTKSTLTGEGPEYETVGRVPLDG